MAAYRYVLSLYGYEALSIRTYQRWSCQLGSEKFSRKCFAIRFSCKLQLKKKSQLTAGELSQQFYKKELDQITNRVFLLYLDKNCLMFAFQISQFLFRGAYAALFQMKYFSLQNFFPYISMDENTLTYFSKNCYFVEKKPETIYDPFNGCSSTSSIGPNVIKPTYLHNLNFCNNLIQ